MYRLTCSALLMLASLPSPVLADPAWKTPDYETKLICRKVPETGSLLRRTKQCFTQAEWDKIAEVQRRGVQKTIDGLTEKGGQ